MFWDSSALVPLLLPEARSPHLSSLLAGDAEVVVWWASPVECQSAIYRRHREIPLPAPALRQALDRLHAFAEDADTVAATEQVRRRAGRLLATHPIRAADALQLAAALIWCQEEPTAETFVCLDDRLSDAALREGFRLLPGP